MKSTPSGEQQLRRILLRPAHADVAFDAVAAIDAGGDGLVEAAMLGLRTPVVLKGDTVERLRVGTRALVATRTSTVPPVSRERRSMR